MARRAYRKGRLSLGGVGAVVYAWCLKVLGVGKNHAKFNSLNMVYMLVEQEESLNSKHGKSLQGHKLIAEQS